MKYLISIIAGLVTGYFCYQLFLNGPKYHGPNSASIKGKTFIYNDECYKFQPVPYVCPLRIKT